MKCNKKPYTGDTDQGVRFRLLKVLKPSVILLALGILYITVHRATGFHLSCPFYGLTGLYCPGCGVSRMLLDLLELDIASAFSANCVLFVMTPFIFAIGLKYILRYIISGKKEITPFDNRLSYAAVAVLIVFAVVRNAYHLDILIP